MKEQLIQVGSSVDVYRDGRDVPMLRGVKVLQYPSSEGLFWQFYAPVAERTYALSFPLKVVLLTPESE